MTIQGAVAIQVVLIALGLTVAVHYQKQPGPIVLPAVAHPACVDPAITLRVFTDI